MTKAATLKRRTKQDLRKSGKLSPALTKSGLQHINQDTPPRGTKLASIISLLSRRQGATIAELAETTGWQRHSIRGAISGTLKKKIGLTVTSEAVDDRGRVYRISSSAS